MKMKKTALAFMAGLSLMAASAACPALAADKLPSFGNNRQMVEYFWNEIFNKHNTSVIDSLTSPKYIQHSPGFADGREAFKAGVQGFLKEFPESRAEIRHIGADGDLVFIHNHITLKAAIAVRLLSISSASKTAKSRSTGMSSRISRKKPKTTIPCSKLGHGLFN